MESIEKLREYGHECCARVDDTIHDLADEIEREITERYMPLPVDADGVPIHCGERMKLDNGHEGEVWLIGVFDIMMSDHTCFDWAKSRHVKPRNLEDVLDEFASAYDRIGGEDDEHWKYLEIVKRYADEIRELMGVDA